ncbi:MAG: hypothetical protein WC291_00935 [Thermodesulfovibrionales bacterium]|jgi:hypothetical protein
MALKKIQLAIQTDDEDPSRCGRGCKYRTDQYDHCRLFRASTISEVLSQVGLRCRECREWETEHEVVE